MNTENRTRCNTGGGLNKLLSSASESRVCELIKVYSGSLVLRSGELLLIFISLKGVVIFFSVVNYISPGWAKLLNCSK